MTPTVHYDFERIRSALLQDGEDYISDKEAGVRLGVSERKVRQARLNDDNAMIIDHMCCKGLKVHPSSVFGDLWYLPTWVEDGIADPEDLLNFLAEGLDSSEGV